MADRDLPPADLRASVRSPEVDRTPPREHPQEPDPGEPSFEAALGRLEAIVGRLEDGDLALEDALVGFEEGVRLSRRLADRLAHAERRIERLVREGGGLATRPLETAPADAERDDPEDLA
jgi:exodeoxyribonuclease VII small subunit